MNNIHRLFRKAVALGAVAFISITSFAQSINSTKIVGITDATNGVAALTGKYIVSELQLINGAASTATVRLFDRGDTNRWILQPAIKSITSWATNYPIVFTNQFGQLDTNILAGTYSSQSTVAAKTNAAVAVATFALPASTTQIVELNYISSLGLLLLADTNVTAVITYRSNP